MISLKIYPSQCIYLLYIWVCSKQILLDPLQQVMLTLDKFPLIQLCGDEEFLKYVEKLGKVICLIKIKLPTTKDKNFNRVNVGNYIL